MTSTIKGMWVCSFSFCWQLNLIDLALQVSGSYAEVQLILRAVTQLLQDAAAEPPKRIRMEPGPPFQPNTGFQAKPPYTNQSTAWLHEDGLVNEAVRDRPRTHAAEQQRRPQLGPLTGQVQQWAPSWGTTRACGSNERFTSNSGYATQWGHAPKSWQVDRLGTSSSQSQRSRVPQQQQW